MNAFEYLLNLSADQKRGLGVEFTPREIAQQPSTWTKAAQIVIARKAEISKFLKSSGVTSGGAGRKNATLILTGAGSSEFVGNAVFNVMRQRMGANVISVPTTHIVTNPETVFLPGRRYVVLSFARSGNSPESMATYNLVKQVCPEAQQIAITCNKNGKLAVACKNDPQSLYIELPEETNDQSLVMTSSYSTMAFTALALCLMKRSSDVKKLAKQVATAGKRIISEYGDLLRDFAQKDFNRACFLGSNALFGAMEECHLKMQEMTEGRVAAMYNSFVGLRHGPQVFASHNCAIIAAVGTDPYVLQYEIDMLREIKAKKQGVATLVICAKATPELREVCTDIVELFPDGEAVHDDFRVMTDVMVGQILGVFKCMQLGLKPDNPSVSGTINRVVQGINIYPYPSKGP